MGRIEKIIKQHKGKKLMMKCFNCEELSYGCDQQDNCPLEATEPKKGK